MRLPALGVALALAATTGVARAEGPAWSIYARSGASVYVSSARTLGGTGGALGVRASKGLLVVQSDAGLLTGLGTVFEWRVAGGVQRVGRWSPALLGTFSLLAGQQTSFLVDAHPWPIRGPAATLGVDLEPLRFTFGRTTMSSLQLGAGAGTDFPGAALGLRLGFFELAVGL